MRREGRKRLGIPREKRNFSLSSPGLPTLRNSHVSNSREFREGWGRGKLVEIVRRILEEVITMGMAFFVERGFLKTRKEKLLIKVFRVFPFIAIMLKDRIVNENVDSTRRYSKLITNRDNN